MTKTHLSDLFDQMDNEEGNKLDDKIQVEMDQTTEEMIEKMFNVNKYTSIFASYDEIKKHLSGMSSNIYTAKQITKFTLTLTDEIINQCLRSNVGTYINFLIQESKDQNHTIITKNITKKLNNIGLLNKKNIKIYGDVGEYLGASCMQGNIEVFGNANGFTGYRMREGKITINGNVGHYIASNIVDGEIIVNGNAGEYAGNQMGGGRLIIHGDTGQQTGARMKNGTIHVKDKIESISRTIEGGDIFHKSRRVVRNGEILDKSYIWN